MKKLMILGGSRYALPVIQKAHELGIYVITCDYLPDNIAHKFSDEFCNVSIIEKEAVLECARKLEIDGITSFACDPGVVTAAYVAEKLGLPTVGPYESVRILQNKGLFRKFLTDNGFSVPHAKSYKSYEEAETDIDFFKWPVIVKPTDSAGSKGVTKVNDISGLKMAIGHALDFSHSDEFIIEDFIEKRGFSSDSDCFSINGRMEFYSFSSQRFDENAENPYAPAAFSWPSSFSKENEEILKNELQRLISLLGMKTSIYNVETREDTRGVPYIMEVSPRGGGNRLAEMVRFATKQDMIEATIRHAVGLPLNEIKSVPYDGAWAEIIVHSKKNGIFERLWLSNFLRTKLIEEDLWVKEGDKVYDFSAANYSLGTLVLRFDSQEELKEAMSAIDSHVRVVVK